MPTHIKTINPCVWLFLTLVASSQFAFAGDWPQVLGPQRNGQSTESLGDWQVRPAILWQKPLGSGYAGPAVVNNRVVIFHRIATEEILEACDTSTGNTIWKASFSTNYRPAIDPDGGPRCVPLIEGNRVFTFGAAGNVCCAELETGKSVWQRPLRAEVDAPDGYFGAGSSPLLIDGVLVICAGGKEGAVVGLSPDDGKILWKSGSMEAAYASPVTIEIAGKPLALCVLRFEAILVRPANGEIVARIAFGARGPTVNAATPLVEGAESFLTASYGIGGKAIAWNDSPKIIWQNDQSISSQYVTPLKLNEYIIGIDGRYDVGSPSLRCIRWRDGQVQWTQADFGTAHLIGTQANWLSLENEGTLTLFSASIAAYKPQGKFKLPGGTYRALPALSNGVLYCRSTDANGTGILIALRVGN